MMEYSRKLKKRRGLPERWDRYSAIGRVIPGTKFIAFKTPITNNKRSFGQYSEDFLTPELLVDKCSKLKMVIDLTNTMYYDPKVFQDSSIEYVKIYCPGHVIPDNKLVAKFFNAVDDFIEKNYDNDYLIGVHCTHGVNRTGYFVCRYMIQRMEISPNQAIAEFDSARGHCQERMKYTEDLCKQKWPDAVSLDTPSPNTPSSNQYGQYNCKFTKKFVKDNSRKSQSPYYAHPRVGSFPRTSFQKTKISSPNIKAKRLYQQYFHGEVQQQYDPHFYENRYLSYGPWKSWNQSPRMNYNVYRSQNPRKYRGPRQYNTPPQHNKSISEDPFTDDSSTFKNAGSLENSLVFSPKSVFSPSAVTPHHKTPRSWWRYTPY